MKLEFMELKLSSTNLFDITKYPGEGLFVVDDGAMWHLASVFGVSVMTMALPNADMLEWYTEKASYDIRQDVLKSVDHKLNSIMKALTEPQQSQGNVNMKEITNLVIAAQKPEVLKDL